MQSISSLLFNKTHFRKLKNSNYSEAAFKHLKSESKEKTSLDPPLTEKQQAIELGQTPLESVVFTAYEISV